MTGKPEKLTKYVVLVAVPAMEEVDGELQPADADLDSVTWEEHSTFSAASANAAIKAAAEKGGNGRYVALPARSWNPRTVTIETAPRVKLS